MKVLFSLLLLTSIFSETLLKFNITIPVWGVKQNKQTKTERNKNIAGFEVRGLGPGYKLGIWLNLLCPNLQTEN